jgi:hypothetical protein
VSPNKKDNYTQTVLDRLTKMEEHISVQFLALQEAQLSQQQAVQQLSAQQSPPSQFYRPIQGIQERPGTLVPPPGKGKC